MLGLQRRRSPRYVTLLAPKIDLKGCSDVATATAPFTNVSLGLRLPLTAQHTRRQRQWSTPKTAQQPHAEPSGSQVFRPTTDYMVERSSPNALGALPFLPITRSHDTVESTINTRIINLASQLRASTKLRCLLYEQIWLVYTC
jgi:hypothetical protein